MTKKEVKKFIKKNLCKGLIYNGHVTDSYNTALVSVLDEILGEVILVFYPDLNDQEEIIFDSDKKRSEYKKQYGLINLKPC